MKKYSRHKEVHEISMKTISEKCAHCHNPAEMQEALYSYRGKYVYFGVVRKGNSFRLVYACHVDIKGYNGRFDGDFNFDIEYDTMGFVCGIYTKCRKVTPANLTSEQVIALTGYHAGCTVVLDLDEEVIEAYYPLDKGDSYNVQMKKDFPNIFDNDVFSAVAKNAGIPRVYGMLQISGLDEPGGADHDKEFYASLNMPDEVLALEEADKRMMAKAVTVFGKSYDSLSTACAAFGQNPETVVNRLKNHEQELSIALILPDTDETVGIYRCEELDKEIFCEDEKIFYDFDFGLSDDERAVSTREVIARYRPDLLPAYDNSNPTGKGEEFDFE